MARPHYSRLYYSFVALGVAAIAVGMFALVSFWHGQAFTDLNELMALAIGVASVAVFYRFRLLLSARSTRYMLYRSLFYWLLVVLYVALAYVVLPDTHLEVPEQLFQQWAIFTLFPLLVALALMRWSALRLYASDIEPRSAIVIRPGPEAIELVQRLRRSPILGIRLAGYFDSPEVIPQEVSELPDGSVERLGSLDDAVAAIATNDYDVVIMGLSVLRTPVAEKLMAALGDSTASLYLVPDARMLGGFKAQSAEIAGIPLLALHENQILGLARIVKRIADIAIAGTALLLLSPLLLLIVLAIKLDSPGPVIFRQKRYGHSGEPIWVNKFRSMVVDQPASDRVAQATQHDPRVTRVGRFLRRTSLDELPQLWNVLDGSMSLVGPRPHAAEHNEFYRKQIPGYMLRHTIQPGITGWAQIHGLRGETETVEKMAKRVEYDLEYIRNWTIWLDFRILLLTAWALVRHRNVY